MSRAAFERPGTPRDFILTSRSAARYKDNGHACCFEASLKPFGAECDDCCCKRPLDLTWLQSLATSCCPSEFPARHCAEAQPRLSGARVHCYTHSSSRIAADLTGQQPHLLHGRHPRQQPHFPHGRHLLQLHRSYLTAAAHESSRALPTMTADTPHSATDSQ